jgi:hypothetical protein
MARGVRVPRLVSKDWIVVPEPIPKPIASANRTGSIATEFRSRIADSIKPSNRSWSAVVTMPRSTNCITRGRSQRCTMVSDASNKGTAPRSRVWTFQIVKEWNLRPGAEATLEQRQEERRKPTDQYCASDQAMHRLERRSGQPGSDVEPIERSAGYQREAVCFGDGPGRGASTGGPEHAASPLPCPRSTRRSHLRSRCRACQ